MTDVWRRGSGSLKDPFVFSIKAERGKRGKGSGGGAGRLDGYPLCGPHLGSRSGGGGDESICVCNGEGERKRERESVSGSWKQARWSLGVVLAALFYLNVLTLPGLLRSSISFLAADPTPLCFTI